MLAEHLLEQQVSGHLALRTPAETAGVRTPGCQNTF
jgi:hypothetical protein